MRRALVLTSAFVALLALSPQTMTAQQPAGPAPVDRRIAGLSVLSPSLPRVRIDVKAPFRHLGRVPINIRNIAAGERIMFADVDGKRIKRMFVLQFEGYLPHSNGTYRYDFSNAQDMGGHRWRANAFAYAVPDRASTDAPEAVTMHNWLREQGYEVAPVQLMYRYLTLGSDARRDELILFYLEGSDDRSWLKDMADNTARWQSTAARLAAASMNAFAVAPFPAGNK